METVEDAADGSRATKRLPFALDRASGESYKCQLAEGLRQAIRSGYYSSGDILPPLNAAAKELGVSEIVARAAYRILAAEGLVVSRQRVGTVVQPPKTPIWRGHVLCVMTDYDFNVQAAGTIGELRELLTRNGYLFSQVLVLLDVKGRPDFAGLNVALSRPVDFAVLVESLPCIERRLSESGVPYVVVGNGSADLPGCVGSVQFSTRRAVVALVRKCVRRRIRSVTIVGASNGASATQRALLAAFADAKILVRHVGLLVTWGERRAERAMRAGFDFVECILSRKRRRLPDLYYADDDWIARGMIAAFLARGVRLPDDVRFACSSNGGFRPMYTKSVAVVECDPYERGAEAARRVYAWLTSRRPFPSSPVEASFVEGGTFP